MRLRAIACVRTWIAPSYETQIFQKQIDGKGSLVVCAASTYINCQLLKIRSSEHVLSMAAL